MRLAALALCMVVAASTAGGGEFNEVLGIGSKAPAWKTLPGVDGKTHSLADLDGKEVVVVVFMCCSCPAVSDYEGRILDFVKKHKASGKVALVGINVNTIEEDLLPEMKARAKEKGYTFPYLFDETQKIAKAYGAVYTPEFFVLDKARKVVYMGAMDDRDNPVKAKLFHLDAAVEATLAGRAITTKETLGRGCRIRYHEVRRKKK